MTNIKPGLAVADYLRNDDRGPWQGVTETCVDCERSGIQRLVDMRCDACNGTTPDDTEERKAARIQLYERTAKVCHKQKDYEGERWFLERIREES